MFALLPNRVLFSSFWRFPDKDHLEGTHQQIIAGDLLLKTDDLEAIADEKSDVLSENVSNLEDDVQECMEDNNEVDKVKPQQISEMFCESDTVLVSYGQTDRLTIHKDEDVDDEVYGENKSKLFFFFRCTVEKWCSGQKYIKRVLIK